MGVTDNEILVRVSGPSGVYVEDHVKFKGESKWIEIDSDALFSEIANNQNKFDTMEIFVKISRPRAKILFRQFPKEKSYRYSTC